MVRSFRAFAMLALALVAVLGAAARADTASHVRVTEAIDDAVRATLPGNTRPEARRAMAGAPGVQDLGRLPGSRVLQHIQILLQRTPADEAAVDSFIAALHDAASADYHHWLTVEQFGARFGTAPADLDGITAWLEREGLTVNFVQPGRMAIDVSGPVAAVERAFGTEIHAIRVAGVVHFANISDPSVPAALAGVVAGPTRLHDFHPHPTYRRRRQLNDGFGGEAVTPGDLATIYNFTPAFAKPITGKGWTVALIEDTDLYSNADWSSFRTTFGLTKAKYPYGTLLVQHPGKACQDPGVTQDDSEAALDVEWASAAAPNATMLLAACASTGTADGLETAIEGLLAEHSPAKIFSVSYGECETLNGAADNLARKTQYAQATAAGVSVFVSAGDSGPASCDDASGAPAALGLNVNALASTVYNVAVGGTDFADMYLNKVSAYWATANSGSYANARSYVPETPWNDTCAGTLLSKYNGFATPYGVNGFCAADAEFFGFYQQVGGGSGGPSSCATGSGPSSGVVGGTCKGWPKPAWQSGLLGNPKDGVRDLPDVSLFASDGAAWGRYYVYCFSDPSLSAGGAPCTGNPAFWAAAGGTSFAAPIMAGIQALVNQHSGVAWGNLNTVYYALAAKEFGTKGSAACNSSLGNASGSGCVFHDITLGDNDQVCQPGTPSCYAPGGAPDGVQSTTGGYKPAYPAGIGYDLATGIGSVNVYNLIANWPVPAK